MSDDPEFQDLINAGQVLEDVIDDVIERLDQNSLNVRRSDWAYHRLGLTRVMLRDGAGGAVPAILCRGLLEEASYWDWAVVSGSGRSWVHDAASAELASLQNRADPSDRIWLKWMIPPGEQIDFAYGEMPRPDEAVKRLGAGVDPRLAMAFDIQARFGLYRTLGIFAHGGAATALAAGSTGGLELPLPVRAVGLHLASAAAVMIVVNELDVTEAEIEKLADAAYEVALKARSVHQVGPASSNGPVLRPAKSKKSRQAAGGAEIEDLPTPSAEILALSSSYVERAEALWSLIRGSAPETVDGLEITMRQTLALAMEHLRVFGNAAEGLIGRAFAPFPARVLYEDGARLRWLVESITTAGPTGDALRAVLGESKHQMIDAQKWLRAGGLSEGQISGLLGSAPALEDVDEGRLPSIDDMLTVAYDVDPSFTSSAGAMYSSLSQFAHATPIASLHLQRDNFVSISMPMFAVASEAATLGHFCIMHIGRKLAGIDLSAEASSLMEDLGDICVQVRGQANGEHFLR